MSDTDNKNEPVETDASAAWERSIPPDDRAVLNRVMQPRPLTMGSRPVLVIIDVSYGFTGTRPLPLMEAIDEYETSCGVNAWNALPQIEQLLDYFRDHERPVVWTTGEEKTPKLFGGATRRNRTTVHYGADDIRQAIHERVAPREGEPVVRKTRASAFFGTPLIAMLTRLGADSVIIAGCTTSGCVRASAVDSFSYGYDTFVIADACFDRSAISHDVSLFDLSHKYAAVAQCNDFLNDLRDNDPDLRRAAKEA